MELLYKRPPKPSELQAIMKAGARITPKGKGIVAHLDMGTLRAFYLGDVLMHELGHHVDLHNVRPQSREKFANWFAQHHGRNPPVGARLTHAADGSVSATD